MIPASLTLSSGRIRLPFTVQQVYKCIFSGFLFLIHMYSERLYDTAH